MHVDPAVFWGGAVSLVLAALSAFGWNIKFILQMQAEQTRYRHELRNELALCIHEAEERLTDRLKILETHSLGLRAWAQENRGSRRHE